MRLIDAEKLIEEFSGMGNFDTVEVRKARSIISYAPTAFDTGRVVEQLSLTSKTALDLAIKRIPGFRFMAPVLQTLVDMCFEEAVRIVKSGIKK